MITVIKRDGRRVDFDKLRIVNAIVKAMRQGTGIVKLKIAEDIANEIESELQNVTEVNISQIEMSVYNKLISKKQRLTAKSYEDYRAVREYQRLHNTIDNKVLGIIDGTNKASLLENSNKNEALVSTSRDLVAEEVSKDISLRMKLPPHIAQAHQDGIIHIHDLGHYLNNSFNCFSYDTKFVTSNGVKKFGDCFDGESVEVIDQYGQWQKATVHKYGAKALQKVTLRSGRSIKEIRCTKDHRWVLKDGTVTTSLKVGDRLWITPEIQSRELYKDPEMFTLGMILGDGSDVSKGKSPGIRIRLCGNKMKYKTVFEECGYKISYVHENGDVTLYRAKKAMKQNFIKNHVWEYLRKDDLIDIFNGYYCADGSTDRNMISTADYDLMKFVEYASAIAGYYVSSITVNNKSTNFAQTRTLYEIRFRKKNTVNSPWVVESIDRSDGTPRETWCVEQPTNHTFTLANGIVTGNCCLVNLEDMLQNGTVINGKTIEKPHSFRTACTIATQIIAQVASGQFGGQSITLSHLAPFVRISEENIRREVNDELSNFDIFGEMPNYRQMVEHIVKKRLAKEIRDGVQTFQYQINTLQTSNGRLLPL